MTLQKLPLGGLPIIAISALISACGGVDGKVGLGFETEPTNLEVSGHVYGVDPEGYERASAYSKANYYLVQGYRDQVMLAGLDGHKSAEHIPVQVDYEGVSRELLAPYEAAVQRDAVSYLRDEKDNFQITDDHVKLAAPFREAMAFDVLEHVDKLEALKVDGTDIVFSGIDDQYKAIVIYAQVSYEFENESGSYSFIESVELTPEVLESANENGGLMLRATNGGAGLAEGIQEDMESLAFADALLHGIVFAQ